MLITLFQVVCSITQSLLLFTYLHPIDVVGGSFLYTMYIMSIVHILLLYADHNLPHFYNTIMYAHCINILTICLLFLISTFTNYSAINKWCFIALQISMVQGLPFYIHYYSKMN